MDNVPFIRLRGIINDKYQMNEFIMLLDEVI